MDHEPRQRRYTTSSQSARFITFQDFITITGNALSISGNGLATFVFVTSEGLANSLREASVRHLSLHRRRHRRREPQYCHLPGGRGQRALLRSGRTLRSSRDDEEFGGPSTRSSLTSPVSMRCARHPTSAIRYNLKGGCLLHFPRV